MFNQILSIILIIILTGSLIAPVEISSVNALADPAIGVKASSNFGTLQIDRSEYDVTYINNTAVKVSGTIATLNSIDTRVTILFTLPDGSTKGSQIPPNGDGTFQTLLQLDSNSQKGTYSVSASYAQNTLGALTFTVKLIPVPKSALPISPPPIKSTQNNSSKGTTDTKQNIQSQSISDSIVQNPSKLPKWIKKTFISYAQGDISEDEMLNAITFLVQNNIIKIQSISQPSTASNIKPENQQTTSSNTPIQTNSQSQNQLQTNPSQQQTLVSASTSNPISNFNIQSILSNPENYKNNWIKFVGKVSHLQPDSNTIQFDTDPSSTDYSNEVFVKLIYNYTSQYSEGDCLSVEGHVTGSDKYTYQSDITATNLQMRGEKVLKISCIDAVYPAMKTIIVNQSQTVGNAKITLEKIDFAKDHTRVKVNFENTGSVDVGIITLDSYLIQNKSQMNIKYVIGDNNDVKTRITSGVISDGYLFFEPANPDKLTVSLDVDPGGLSLYQRVIFDVG